MQVRIWDADMLCWMLDVSTFLPWSKAGLRAHQKASPVALAVLPAHVQMPKELAFWKNVVAVSSADLGPCLQV